MKKLQIIFFATAIVTIGTGILNVLVYVIFSHKFNGGNIEIIRDVALLALGLCFLVLFALGILTCIKIIKTGSLNLKKCDDSFWDELDKCKRGTMKTNAYYLNQIEIINYFYSDKGPVERELIKKKDVHKLFLRLDFLDNRVSLYDDLITLASSLAISILASMTYELMHQDDSIVFLIRIITILFVFFTLALGQYCERGQGGTYKHLVEDYERKILIKKIESLYSTLTLDKLPEECFKTKQVLIHVLVDKLNATRGKEEKQVIKKDIERVEQLNLCIDEPSSYKRQFFIIDGEKCCLLYKYEAGKANKLFCRNSLPNNEYRTLYDILLKYNLLTRMGSEI